jgi:hypothetical protein
MAIKSNQYQYPAKWEMQFKIKLQNCSNKLSACFYLMLRSRLIGAIPPLPHAFSCPDTKLVTGILLSLYLMYLLYLPYKIVNSKRGYILKNFIGKDTLWNGHFRLLLYRYSFRAGYVSASRALVHFVCLFGLQHFLFVTTFFLYTSLK